MATMKFKTTAKCGGCEAAMRMKLQDVVSDRAWSLDLSSPDKVLTVNADVSASAIMDAVKDAGFQIEEIK